METKQVKEIIAFLKLHAENSVEESTDILNRSEDYFAKHKASSLKFKAEDSLNLLSALENLLFFSKPKSGKVDVLNIKFSDCVVSVRALNCLNCAEIKTIGELIVYSKNEFMKMRNVGKRTTDELVEFLAEHKLSFRKNGK